MIEPLKRLVTIVIATMIGFVLLWTGYIFFAQEKMIYFPRGYTASDLAYADEETVRIEFTADNPGNWFFHCHILYHLDAGMARVVEYQV